MLPAVPDAPWPVPGCRCPVVGAGGRALCRVPVTTGSARSCEHPRVTHDPPPPGSPDPGHDLDHHDGAETRESAYELLQRGRDLARHRHYAQAVIVLERAARLEPGRGSILEPLGRACFMSGQHERARETFEALLAVDPSSHYGHFALGQSLRRLGRNREAMTHLRLAVALAPRSALYHGALARALARAEPPVQPPSEGDAS
jgi:Flp pilus assembly protein TadD